MAYTIRFLTVLALGVSLILLAQCGEGNATFCVGNCSPVSGETEFLYVTSSSHDGEILSFPVDHGSGNLGVATTVSGPVTASGMAAAQNQFMYVASAQEGIIDGYKIDKTSGALTVVPGSPFSPAGQISFSPVGIAAGAAVYTTAQDGISGFAIGSDGALSTVVGSPYAGGFSGQAVLVQTNTLPANTFLYATNPLDADGRISVFRIVAPVSGVLTPVPGNFVTGPSSGPGAIVFDGAFSTPYVFIGLNNSKQIAAFSVDSSSGDLTPVPGSPFLVGFAPAFLAVDVTQNFLYALNATDGTISAYEIASSGSLTSVTGSPFVVGAGPGGMAVTLSNYLYVTLPDSNMIEGFSINSANGGLTALATSPFPVLAPRLLSVVQVPSP